MHAQRDHESVPFIRRFESVPWLILNGAGSKSMRKQGGYSPLRREMDNMAHLPRKVRRRQCRTQPPMNTYRRLELASGECGRAENERGLVAEATRSSKLAYLSTLYV